ncbi:hypothetical protein HK100_004400, partial [Physocladia obscura]
MRISIAVAFLTVANQAIAQTSETIAEAALIWSIPLYEVGILAYKALATAKVGFNSLIQEDTVSSPSSQVIVAPNIDTLYSEAFLDLSNTGVEVTAPINESADRYLLLEFLDVYTNVFASASRRNYPKGSKFLVYGPHSLKVANESVYDAVFTSPTDFVWLLSRTEVKYYNNATDTAIANSIQKTVSLSTTTSATPRSPAILLPAGVLTTDSLYYWKFIGNLATLFPPPSPAVFFAFASVGLTASGFNATGLNATVIAELTVLPTYVSTLLQQVNPVTTIKDPRSDEVTNNNWYTFPAAGNYGTDYVLRAGEAIGGIAGNIPADAVYYRAEIDNDFDILIGNVSYFIDLPSTGLPNNAFWSITPYYQSNNSLIYNSAEIYAVGTHSGANLVYKSDGSGIRIVLQSTKPTQDDVNWLPTPDGTKFILYARFYQPPEQVLNNSFALPLVQKLDNSVSVSTQESSSTSTQAPYSAPTEVAYTNLYSSAEKVFGPVLI